MAEVEYGRKNKNGPRTLDDGELNLGASQVIPVPIAHPFALTAVAPGNIVKLLDLSGDGRVGRTIVVTMGAMISAAEADQLFNPGSGSTVRTTGPLTGIVEFGNGAVIAVAEFDIPPPSRLPTALSAFPGAFKSSAFSGVSLTLPASALRVYARNDNNLACLFTTPVPGIIGSNNNGDIDPTVFAHVNYGETFGANKHLRKTVWFVNGGSTDAFGVGAVTQAGIPPFAKSVWFPRDPLEGSTLTIQFLYGFNGRSATYTIPVGSVGPLEIPPHTQLVSVAQATGSITSLAAVFDLAI